MRKIKDNTNNEHTTQNPNIIPLNCIGVCEGHFCVVVFSESVKKTQSGVEEHKLVGKLAMLIKKQTNRHYFSDLPIGTLFIVLEEIDIGAYDLLGFFIGVEHNKYEGVLHCTGYIESGSWVEVGSIEDNIQILKNKAHIYFPYK